MLCEKHPHALDDILTFVEENHAYTYTPTDEKIRISMSGILKRCFPDDFDGAATSKKYFAGWLRDDTNKYWGLANYLMLVRKLTRPQAELEIQALWSVTGEMARNDGTGMHQLLEDYINGLWKPEPPPDGGLIPGKPPHEIVCYLGLLDQVSERYPDMGLYPWRTEFKMVVTHTFEHQTHDEIPYDVTIPVCAGTADLIMKDKLGRYWIFDWKRVDPKKKGKLGKRKSANMFPDSDATGFMEAYKNNAFTKYSAQLYGYKWMFERGGYMQEGEEVAGTFIVQIHPDLENAHWIEAGSGLDDEFEYQVYAMMDDEVARARGEKKAALTGPHCLYVHDPAF